MNPLGFLEDGSQSKKDAAKEKVMDALKEQFRPEFLNRVDEVVIFNYLEKEQIKKIVELELEKVQERLVPQNVTLEVTETAKELLASRGFDPTLGARPLRRVIQQMVLDPLALKIVSGEINAGEKVLVDVSQGTIVVESAYKMVDMGKAKGNLEKSRT